MDGFVLYGTVGCDYFYTLNWLVQCHKEVYKDSRMRLEYAYLSLEKFIMNRVIFNWPNFDLIIDDSF